MNLLVINFRFTRFHHQIQTCPKQVVILPLYLSSVSQEYVLLLLHNWGFPWLLMRTLLVFFLAKCKYTQYLWDGLFSLFHSIFISDPYCSHLSFCRSKLFRQGSMVTLPPFLCLFMHCRVLTFISFLSDPFVHIQNISRVGFVQFVPII